MQIISLQQMLIRQNLIKCEFKNQNHDFSIFYSELISDYIYDFFFAIVNESLFTFV